MNRLLDTAQKDLASAKAFYAEHQDADGKLSAADLETYGTMVEAAEAAATQYRLASKADKTAEEFGMFDEAIVKQNAENEHRLPESLKDEPPKAEQIRLAGLNRNFQFETDLNIGNTMLWEDAQRKGVPKEELRLVIGTDNKGGYWTPDYWERMIISEWRMIEGFSELISPMMTDHGNTVYIPTRTAAQVTRSTNIGTTLRTEAGGARDTYETDVEATYGQTPLDVYKVMQAQAVSTELLEDSFINVAQEVGATIGQWFGEFMEHCFTNGTGTSQPKGAWHGIPAGSEVNTLATGNPTVKDFHALTTGNPRLRGGNNGYAFVTSRAVWGATVRAIDTEYLPWWGLNLTSEGRMLCFGYPVYYGTFVDPSIAANANPVGVRTLEPLLADAYCQ